MIRLTKASGNTILVNEDFIAIAEETPDTVLTLQSGNKYFVKESVDEIYEKIMQYEKEKKSL